VPSVGPETKHVGKRQPAEAESADAEEVTTVDAVAEAVAGPQSREHGFDPRSGRRGRRVFQQLI